jgi:hypothetical protein
MPLLPWKLLPQCFVSQEAHYATTCQSGLDIYLLAEPHYRLNHLSLILEELRGESRCWPHLLVRCLSRDAPGGHCWYPADRVPLCTSLKLRQGVGQAPTCCHVPHSAGSRPPRLRGLRYILGGGVQCCRVSHSSGSRLSARGALVLTRVPWPSAGYRLWE